MPSESQKQHNFFQAVSASKRFADRVGVKQSVAKEYLEADKKAGLWQPKNEKDKK